MDYQYHNNHHHHQQQQQQWRPRPPIQPNPSPCPTCSFPHFPFCPPTPNPFAAQFQIPADHHHQHHRHSFPRPGFEPRFPPPPPPPPPQHVSHPPHPYGNFPYQQHNSNGFVSAEVDRSHKRPRVDGDESERRLKMVRDHGAPLRPNPETSWTRGNSFDPNAHAHAYNHGYYDNSLFGSSGYHAGHPPPPLPPSPPPPPPPLPPPLLVPDAASAWQSPAQPSFHSKSFTHYSTGFANQDLQGGHGMLPKSLSSDKRTVVDASQLFKKPHRYTRPDRFVIILRGLPGNGKSYLAKMLRDIEVENGGSAPRIHSMDDYFMIEVEKVEESNVSKSSGSVRGKKPIVKKVMEYCYEPEMEETYRSSMLKAFKKTLEDGAFTFIIVDDRNLRKADFSQFWAIAKNSGYEVYILEASNTDLAGCAARNVHGFTLDDIRKMAEQWEEAPPFYLRLDAKSLFSGDDLIKSGIQEVDMEMEDEDNDERPSDFHRQNANNNVSTSNKDNSRGASPKEGKIWNDDENAAEVKELGRSKWSNELDEDDLEQTEPIKGKINALSGLVQAYGKEAKSVRWGDKGANIGFSISAAKKANASSLVIGPGAGYNLKSNPLREQNGYVSRKSNAEPKKQSVFEEQLRAERESFQAVFSKRQLRIGLDSDDE